MHDNLRHKASLPTWAVPRGNEWTFVGIITDRPKKFEHEKILEELIALTLNRGGLREVDRYPEGAVCWLKRQ